MPGSYAMEWDFTLSSLFLAVFLGILRLCFFTMYFSSISVVDIYVLNWVQLRVVSDPTGTPTPPSTPLPESFSFLAAC